MAKLGSGTRGPAAQAMLPLPVLVLLLLLASVHAVPAMAQWEEHLIGPAEKLTPDILRFLKVPKEPIKGVRRGFRFCKMARKAHGLIDQQNPGPGRAAVYTVGFATPTTRLPVVSVDIAAKPGARPVFCAGDDLAFGNVRARPSSISLFGGSQSLTTPPFRGTVYEYPTAAAVARPDGAELVLGRSSVPNFTYRVLQGLGDGTTTAVWVPTTTAAPSQQQGRRLGSTSSQATTATTTIPLSINPKYPDDSRYYVNITGIRVGAEVVETPTELGFRHDGTGGVYLSTTEPYTYLESGVYFRLKAVLVKQIERLNNPGPRGATATPTPSSSRGNAAGKLCYYVRAETEELTVPPMAILFGGNAVMKLGAPANVWYREGPSTVCLAILPTNTMSPPGQASVLGSWLQSGRAMTIDLTPRAGALAGTLTF